MENRTITINRLPAITYRWLKMNGAVVEDTAADSAYEIQIELPEGVEHSSGNISDWKKIEGGAGAELDQLVEDANLPVDVYSVGKGVKIKEPIRLNFDYQNQTNGVFNPIAVKLEENAELTIVAEYHSAPEASGSAGVQFKVEAAENAVLHLVQIQRLGQEFTFINDIGGSCDDRANIDVIQLFLSGKDTYSGLCADLHGYKSQLNVEIGYQVRGKNRLDMNYDAVQTGKKSTSVMNISGVLRDEAFKIFRGTIDFQYGCSGSTGDELENVLLMNDGVINQTIPLILCGEEDVVGNHGATIGRLDEGLMFYLESRGMNKEEIYEMMAKARIDAVIRKISDERTKAELLGSEEEEEA